MNNLLKNRKIGVAVTGSIAIYKTLELIRLFVKAGAEVRVVISAPAQKFITALTFEAISGHTVLTDENESWAQEVENKSHNHIGLAKWAETFVVAPASANTIAKLANGIADNLLTQTLLAHRGAKILAPSANSAMLDHPITKANLKMLGICEYEILEPSVKVLVCGDEGKGAMAEINDIFWATARALLREEFWEYRNAIVTGGGTRENIDSVRFIGNHSSGKMASSLVTALYARGANPTYITTIRNDSLPSQINQIVVSNGDEMGEAIRAEQPKVKTPINTKPTLMRAGMVREIAKEPYLFMAAAVADYKNETQTNGKLKKEQIGEKLSLELVKTADILTSLDKSGMKVVGFKAEFDAKSAKKCAQKMLKDKRLDAVCLNILSEKNGFGSDMNEMEFVSEGANALIPLQEKLFVSFEILELAKKL